MICGLRGFVTKPNGGLHGYGIQSPLLVWIFCVSYDTLNKTLVLLTA
jgi:hypothetical protein